MPILSSLEGNVTETSEAHPENTSASSFVTPSGITISVIAETLNAPIPIVVSALGRVILRRAVHFSNT